MGCLETPRVRWELRPHGRQPLFLTRERRRFWVNLGCLETPHFRCWEFNSLHHSLPPARCVASPDIFLTSNPCCSSRDIFLTVAHGRADRPFSLHGMYAMAFLGCLETPRRSHRKVRHRKECDTEKSATPKRVRHRHGACGRAGRSRAAKLGGTAARAPRAARGHEGHCSSRAGSSRRAKFTRTRCGRS